MSSCPLPFRKKWRERCATPVLKVAVATWTLEIEKQLRVFMCVVLQPSAVKKKKSQVQFCSTVSSPNCPIPLVLYFLVCGVDLVGNWSVRQKVIVIWLCFLIQLSVELISSKAGHLCSSWRQCRPERGQLITPCATSDSGFGRHAPLLYPPCLCWHSSLSRPFSDDDSISSTTGW